MNSRGRPKKFDPNQKLEIAMDLFWKHGYEGTSLNDLLKKMQISRQSLYDTFGDKHTLFETCLDYYRDNTGKLMDSFLSSPNAGLGSIKSLFQTYIDNTALDQTKKSCFMANTSMELALHDISVKNKVEDFFEFIENAFHQALINAQKNNEIRSSKDLLILARFLTSTMMGIGILSKAGTSSKKIEEVFDIIVSALNT